MLDTIRKYFRSLEKESIPQLSINCVIFGFHEKSLNVIVNNIDLGDKGLMVLPGGYVKQTEDLDDAVARIVRQSTGLENILLKQFEVFGSASRSFADGFDELAKGAEDPDKEILKWMSRRFVSICYLALVNFEKIELKPTQFMQAAQWLPVEKAKLLALDHTEMVKTARESLKKELPHAPIASHLLPAKFTLPELQSLVEAIAGKKLDRPNFRRKVLQSGVLVKVGVDSSGKRRPADVYAFKQGKRRILGDLSIW